MSKYKINLVKNKSITYIFPFVSSYVDFKFTNKILNSYVSFENDELFCVMYKWSSDHDFLKFEKEISENPLYIGHSDFDDKVVYRFKLNDDLRKGMNLFLQGDYSLFSEKHKKCVSDYVKSSGYKNAYRIIKIMDKDEDLSSDPPDMMLEDLMENVKKISMNQDVFE